MNDVILILGPQNIVLDTKIIIQCALDLVQSYDPKRGFAKLQKYNVPMNGIRTMVSDDTEKMRNQIESLSLKNEL